MLARPHACSAWVGPLRAGLRLGEGVVQHLHEVVTQLIESRLAEALASRQTSQPCATGARRPALGYGAVSVSAGNRTVNSRPPPGLGRAVTSASWA